MATQWLACPRCEAPVPPRIEGPRFSFVDRYTCNRCGLMTLREELIPRSELRSVLGGTGASSVAAPQPFSLTLRPTGILGDQSDATFESVGGLNGVINTSAVTVSHVPANATISTVSYHCRAQFDFSDLGPVQPTANMAVTYNGHDDLGVDFGMSMLQGVVYQYDGSPAPKAPDGVSLWTAAIVNALTVRMTAFVDDAGSGNITTISAMDFWIEVTGTA